jgi:hypothetical protein
MVGLYRIQSRMMGVMGKKECVVVLLGQGVSSHLVSLEDVFKPLKILLLFGRSQLLLFLKFLSELFILFN